MIINCEYSVQIIRMLNLKFSTSKIIDNFRHFFYVYDWPECIRENKILRIDSIILEVEVGSSYSQSQSVEDVDSFGADLIAKRKCL